MRRRSMAKKKQNPEDQVDVPEQPPETASVSEEQVQVPDSLPAPEAQPPVAEKAIPRFF